MKYKIQIVGFRSEIKNVEGLIADIEKISPECTIQLMDAEKLSGHVHVLHATIHAVNAFERGENIANDLGLEICVRASAQRQISKALDTLGIKKGKINVCAVLVGCNTDIIDNLEVILGKRDDSILIPNDLALKRIYNISDLEDETTGSITRIMMERTALMILET